MSQNAQLIMGVWVANPDAMDTSLEELANQLRKRCPEIARNWYQAVAYTGYTPSSTAEVIEVFRDLAEAAVECLLGETFDPDQARSIGTRLVSLNFLQPESIGNTLTVLLNQLTAGLPLEMLQGLQPRLAELIGGIGAGYHQHARQAILNMQEEIRQAAETRRHMAEIKRQEVEQRNRAILQALPDLIVIENTNGDYLDFHLSNPDSIFIPEPIIGKNSRDYLSPELNELHLAMLKRVLESGQMEIRVDQYQAFGQEHFFESRMVPFIGDNLLVFVRDITERVQYEGALRASEARYRAVVEDQTEMIVRWILGGRLTFVNDAYCRYFNENREELIGKSWLPLIFEEDLPLVNAMLSRLPLLQAGDPPIQVEHRVILPGGEIRWQQWINRPVFSPDGHQIEVQAVGRDITDKKREEEALKQMAAQLINAQEQERSKIARNLHDDILSQVGAMLFNLEDSAASNETINQGYHFIVDQLRETINGLRLPTLSYGLPAALEDLCDDYADHYNPEIRVQFETGTPPARYDPEIELHLYRIVQEACYNALRHSYCSTLRVTGQILEGLIELTVEDDGIGFDLPHGGQLDLASILAKKHFGLAGMYERALLIGAHLHFITEIGLGTRIQVSWRADNHLQLSGGAHLSSN